MYIRVLLKTYLIVITSNVIVVTIKIHVVLSKGKRIIPNLNTLPGCLEMIKKLKSMYCGRMSTPSSNKNFVDENNSVLSRA